MPTISLRLTEEEHAALKAWAHDSRRSIQKEAVWRLFSDFPAHVATTVAQAERRATEEVRAMTGRDDLTVTYEVEPIDTHFKPDFGKKLK